MKWSDNREFLKITHFDNRNFEIFYDLRLCE